MDGRHGGKRARSGFIIALAAAAAALSALAVMDLLTLPSADDFWYKSFMSGGLRRYLSLMKRHYLTFNGRVLVHVADHAVLRLGNWCFAMVSAALFTLIPWALSRASGRERGLAVWALALFLPAVLSVPRGILNQGILWTSAFFNYVLPAAMLTVDVLLFELCSRRERTGFLLGALCVVWSAACGATTEQSGFAAVLLAAFFLGKAFVRRRGRAAASLAFFGSAAGLLSIFASPATRLRLSSGASLGGLGEILSAMYANMGPCAGELCSSWLVGAALAALFLLSGAAASGRLGRRWPLALSALPAVLSLAVLVCPEGLRTPLFTGLCFAAGAAAAVLAASGEEAPGVLVLAGLASFAAILVTDSFGGRTLLPFLLTLLAADAVLLSGYIRDLGGAVAGLAPASLLALGLAAVIPFTGGMLKNRRVELENMENLRAAQETGELRYCLDYDLDYTWLKLQTLQASFIGEYLEGEGLPADTPVRFYSHFRPDITAGGTYQYPAYIKENGDALVWIRVVEAFGGAITVRSGFGCLTVTLPWTQCDIDSDAATPDKAVFTWIDNGVTRRVTAERFQDESRTWYPLEIYTEVLGFTVTYNPAQNAYAFSAPN